MRSISASACVDKKEIENFTLNNEISHFNAIFTKISDKLKIISKEKQKVFFEDFQLLMKNEIEKINKFVDNAVPNYIYASNVLNSKIKIFNYFIESVIEYMKMQDTDSAPILGEISKSIKDSSDEMHGIIEKLYPKIEEKAENFKVQLENAFKTPTAIPNDSPVYLEERIKELVKEKEFLEKQNNEDKLFYQDKIDKLEHENKVMMDKFLKLAKEPTSNEPYRKKKSNTGQTGSNVSNDTHTNMNISNINNSYVGNNQGQSNYDHTKRNSHQFTQNNTVINPTGTKLITKKTIREMIDEIYASKVLYDKKCLDNKMVKETMEQHMYTYLNQKYGLKSLIIEWAASLVNGIKIFSNEDSDICLFGKILRNELEEDSRQVVQRLKVTISEILTFYLKAKNPLKSNADIKNFVKQKSESFIVEEEWKGIIYYVYENEDAKFLENKIIEYIKKKYIDVNKQNENKKLSRDEMNNLSRVKEEYKILYLEFQKILMDFQIKSRDKYLKNFSTLFKKYDSNSDGLLNETEFFNLMENLNTYTSYVQENTERFINILDPYNHKNINFSDCVTLFASEMINENDEFGNNRTICLLDKICIDENSMDS